MLSAMQTRRWVDPSQPQTLQIAVFLLYAQAVLLLLFGGFLNVIGLALIAGGVGAGYGIANERKWGYGLGLLMAFLPFVARVAYGGLNDVFRTDIIELMFEVALVVLLLHPQSREYERIWFK
jgi:hypothetical protein